MRNIVYVDEPPTMEIRKGLVHIRYEGVAEFVMSPHNFQQAINAACGAIEEWERARGVVYVKRGGSQP